LGFSQNPDGKIVSVQSRTRTVFTAANATLVTTEQM
jgi:hypothetical protein